MIGFKIYNEINPNNHGRISLKQIYHFIKKSALIGSLNDSISGAIATILATYGYIALPGFDPIIVMDKYSAFCWYINWCSNRVNNRCYFNFSL